MMTAASKTSHEKIVKHVEKASPMSVICNESLTVKRRMAQIWRTVLNLPKMLAAMTLPLGGGDHAQPRHDELARDDDERDPRRKGLELDEGEQCGAHEYLVGKRIEELAQVGDLVSATGEIAVDGIGGGDDHEHGGGDPGLPVDPELRFGKPRGPRREQRGNENGDEQDTRQSDDVRGGPDAFGIIGHGARPPPQLVEEAARELDTGELPDGKVVYGVDGDMDLAVDLGACPCVRHGASRPASVRSWPFDEHVSARAGEPRDAGGADRLAGIEQALGAPEALVIVDLAVETVCGTPSSGENAKTPA